MMSGESFLKASKRNVKATKTEYLYSFSPDRRKIQSRKWSNKAEAYVGR